MYLSENKMVRFRVGSKAHERYNGGAAEADTYRIDGEDTILTVWRDGNPFDVNILDLIDDDIDEIKKRM